MNKYFLAVSVAVALLASMIFGTFTLGLISSPRFVGVTYAVLLAHGYMFAFIMGTWLGDLTVQRFYNYGPGSSGYVGRWRQHCVVHVSVGAPGNWLRCCIMMLLMTVPVWCTVLLVIR